MKDSTSHAKNYYATPFLKLLANTDDLCDQVYWFESLDDKGRDSRLHTFSQRSFPMAYGDLDALNQRGAGIFVCVNGTDGKGRKKSNICELRAWFVDIDYDKAKEKLDIERLLEKLPLPPSMWIETPGGLHLYWLMKDGAKNCDDATRTVYESELKQLQASLSRYGADPACVDCNRILRLPGFYHNKADAQMVYFNDNGGTRYTRAGFFKAFKFKVDNLIPTVLPEQPPTPAPSLPDRDKVFQRAIRYLRKCPPAIQGQNGSKTCFETALKIQDGFDLSQEEALVLLGQYYNPRCEPPWTERELRHKVADAAAKCGNRGYLLRRKDEPRPAKKTASPGRPPRDEAVIKDKRLNKLIEWIMERVELFHDGSNGFASTKGAVQQTFRLDTELFEEWLVSKLYKDYPTLLKIHEKADLLAFLRAKAKHDSPYKPVYTRIARLQGEVYFDLCRPDWQQVRITPEGWSVIDAVSSPVVFQRFSGMKGLPLPAKEGRIGLFRKFLNISDTHYRLCLAWIVQAICGGMSFPVLVINGVQGTGKTTACRVIRSLIDPSEIPDSGTPRNEPDALLAASRSWVQSWDNISSLSNDLSDLVCRIASGAGFRTRKLFSNSEENLVSVARPIMMNGIPDLLRRDDLADRAVPIKLLPLENNRKTEREYWASLERAKPQILGGLFDMIVGVLCELPNTEVRGSKPRMLDFALLGVALEKVCNWGEGAFLEAYDESRTETAHGVLEGSIVAQTLISLAESSENGAVFSTVEIRKALVEIAKRDGLDVSDRAFCNDRVFKGVTERLNPALSRCYGFVLQWCRTNSRNVYRLFNVGTV